MSHGGFRPGAGRPPGSKSKRTIGSFERQARKVRALAAATAADKAEAPAVEDFRALDNLRTIAKQFMDQATAEKSKEGGGDRRFFNECLERAARVLKDIVPYEAPKLVAIKVGGDRDSPLPTINELDLSRLTDEELETLGSILTRCTTPIASESGAGGYDPAREVPRNQKNQTAGSPA
jgi:hypothetical protein